MRPLLLPGTHLLSRPEGSAQLGLDPSHAVRVQGPMAQRSLWDPSSGAPALHAPRALERLIELGVAADDDRDLRAALPASGPGSEWARHTLAALFRAAPARMARAVAGRHGPEVSVETFGHPLGALVAEDLRALLLRCDLRPAGRRRPGPAPRGAPAQQTRVVVLAGLGEPDRVVVDRLVVSATPHLLLRLTEGAAVVGPLVVPGRTACLRCLDAFRTEDDPAWPELVAAYARATGSDRADGIPEPADAALAAVAVGWAVRELATHLEGGRPATLSGTVRLGPRLESVQTRTWPQHPHCGCTWE